MARLLAIVAVLVVIGVYAPRFAPGLVAGFAQGPTEDPPVPKVIAVEQPLSPRKVVLRANSQGHFSTDVLINGRRINVLIDTGATLIALNEATANRLGIKPARRAFTAPVSTGNGVIKAAPVTLSDVRLGGIRLGDVNAVVVPGDALPFNLLGMSFLSRLSSFEVTRDRLLLVN